MKNAKKPQSLGTSVLSYFLSSCLFGMLLVAPVSADVKIISSIDITGLAPSSGESTVYIKGLKMRTEQDQGGDLMVSILDVENQQMIQLNAKKKRAEVFDLRDAGEQLNQIVDSGSAGVSLEPTGETRTVAGTACEVHDLSVRLDVEMAPGSGMGATMTMDGTSCLVANAPGMEDYQRFYTAMAEKGLFVGDPRAAQGPGAGTFKGLTELYSEMAKKGISYESDMETGFEGSGMMAKMLSNMSVEMETTVLSVSTESLPDSLFEVPKGWKVKNIK